MKKKYITPETVCFDIEAQQMLATSFETSTNKTTSDTWSEKRGWDSSNWSNTNEEEE